MICNEARNLLPSWIEGGDAGSRAGSLVQHLDTCAACGAFAAGLRANAEFLRDRLGPIADLVRPDLSSLAAAAPPKAPPQPKTAKKSARERSRRSPALGAAGILVLVAAGVGAFFVLRDDGEPEGDGTRTEARVPAPAKGPTAPRPAAPAKAPTAEPARPAIPERPAYRPVPVQPGINQLLPGFLKQPAQLTLERIWRSLEKQPGEIAGVIEKLRRSEDEQERALLALTLAGGGAEARAELSNLLAGDGSALVRSAAAAAIAHVPGGKSGTITVVKILRVNVGRIEDAETRRLLLVASETERDPEVLALLIQAIAPSQADDETITSRILELIRAPDARVRNGALQAVRLARIEDVRVLTELVEDEELPLEVRVAIVGLIPDANPDRAQAALIGLLGASEEDAVRLAALQGLARKPTEEGRSELVRILRSDDSTAMRTAAVNALAAHQSREALEILEEIAASDPDPAVRDAAGPHVEMLRRALQAEEEKER